MRKKIGTVLLAGALLALVTMSGLQAQPRDAGSKIRGDIGRSSVRSVPARSYATQPSVVTRPAEVARPAYEAYSIEPLAFEVGDQVRITDRGANLMVGRRSLGRVPGGAELRVVQIRGPWVGTVAQIDGREIGGWIWYNQVVTTDQK